MEWFIDNWFIVVGLLALVTVVVWVVYTFFGLPTSTQIKKIKEWLLYAVVLAEAELGSGTGQLKLRFVYDMFMDKFPMVAKIISFETFGKWVEEALEVMRHLLATNKALAALVEPVELTELEKLAASQGITEK